MLSNEKIIENVYKLSMAVRLKNHMVANALEKAVPNLLVYEKNLADASKSELLKIREVGSATVDYILKIIEGENIHKIVKSIEKPKKGRLGEMKWKW